MLNNTLLFSSLNFPNADGEDVGEVCIANISPRERQKRLRIGIAAFIVSLVILAVLVILNVNPIWRLLLLFMFWGAGVSYFEARDKTCIALAMNKSRKMSEVEEKIEDANELKQVYRQSVKLIAKAFFVALILTALAFILP